MTPLTSFLLGMLAGAGVILLSMLIVVALACRDIDRDAPDVSAQTQSKRWHL